jgi:AcrR family transcriptional regulator
MKRRSANIALGMPIMFDLTINRDKIIDAALRLAASDGWDGLGLDRIAHAAGVSLNDIRTEFSSKTEILAAYTRKIDDAVLAKADPADASLAARDRLFDVLMTRFELMAPQKQALKRIKQDLQYRPGQGLAQLGAVTGSIYWMLAAAGVDADGTRGMVRVPGLLGLYARIFNIWLEDDDPGLSRTMAALDSRLRRGERTMQRVDDFGAGARRFCASVFSLMSRRSAPEPSHHDEPPEPAPSGSTPGQTNGSAEPGPMPAT